MCRGSGDLVGGGPETGGVTICVPSEMLWEGDFGW